MKQTIYQIYTKLVAETWYSIMSNTTSERIANRNLKQVKFDAISIQTEISLHQCLRSSNLMKKATFEVESLSEIKTTTKETSTSNI